MKPRAPREAAAHSAPRVPNAALARNAEIGAPAASRASRPGPRATTAPRRPERGIRTRSRARLLDPGGHVPRATSGSNLRSGACSKRARGRDGRGEGGEAEAPLSARRSSRAPRVAVRPELDDGAARAGRARDPDAVRACRESQALRGRAEPRVPDTHPRAASRSRRHARPRDERLESRERARRPRGDCRPRDERLPRRLCGGDVCPRGRRIRSGFEFARVAVALALEYPAGQDYSPDNGQPKARRDVLAPKWPLKSGTASLSTTRLLKQCLGSRRISNLKILRREVQAWNRRMNRERVTINSKFDRKAASRKFGYKRALSSGQRTSREPGPALAQPSLRRQ